LHFIIKSCSRDYVGTEGNDDGDDDDDDDDNNNNNTV
jgi:hypothetical protein